MTGKTTLRAGSLIRSDLIGAIKQCAFTLDLDIEVTELHKTWIESIFGLTLKSGTVENVIIFNKWLNETMEEIS
jgi:hypothetical protein